MTDVVSHPVDNSPEEVGAATRGSHLVIGEVVILYALSILAALATKKVRQAG